MHKVLVVDDEPSVASALKRLLRRNGFEVETAGSGREALENLPAFKPDIVLSDFRMPEMTGAELLAVVKRQLPYSLRIIISAYADLDSVIASVNEGEICHFISKPWSDEELPGKLKALLKERELMLQLTQHLDGREAVRVANLIHHPSTVEVRLEKAGAFSVDKAIEVIQAFAGVLERQQLEVFSGMLTRHGGKVSFIAEVGAGERLSLEVPINEATRSAEPHEHS